ncbi:hypothetical protein [Yaniella halotolerans]|uniref:hypothetical protein n=1 Tax=Yaniella halotolerans TaxID=225453 RepID=UPI0003B614C9|nr:hypothetical protein [Yaniella halotolerans]
MKKTLKSSSKPGIGEILGASAVALGSAVVGMYVLNRLRRHSKTQALLDTLPPRTDVGLEDHTAEPADDVYDPAEVTRDSATRLEELRYDELYQLAKQHFVVGRSSMAKPELVAALQDLEINHRPL